ncbi:MAG: hypothetical protein A3K19_32245 [Lentisphaerae bacterium RIFOXYB12_FULL_65_16]|nr:MAG: hypothetical protein A3K18_17790 [Lentisphaerae bacterium RIFOXYA12_64_32]OGV90133.1 MAG: hypothetical protein A3K19_32245 [Lentisphaerae bacterium RIFOXYB12_FULL_65_16]
MNTSPSDFELVDGSRIAIVGGGPAGSFFAFFLLQIAGRVDLKLEVDIYEPRDYSRSGPAGCNMCGGVVSETLVQLLAVEGINLPPSVVRRGLDSYVLHTDGAAVQIRLPQEEMRIAALYRGSGPKGSELGKWDSLDATLLGLACGKGARHIPQRVAGLAWEDGRPVVSTQDGRSQRYDLLVGSFGVNSGAFELFRSLDATLAQPRTAKAYIGELHLGAENIEKHLGNSMHAFLLDIPGLEFAALIPKAHYVTVCILGRDVDASLIERFMTSPEVSACLPADANARLQACKCSPRINVGGSRHCFGDRVLLVGDCGVSRLYKDGIGAAYKAAKAGAVTAVFHGVSRQDFQKYYWPMCRTLELDNKLGKLMFACAIFVKKMGLLRRGMLRLTAAEQAERGPRMDMSMILWDLFTGSAPYRDIAFRAISPGFLLRFAAATVAALFCWNAPKKNASAPKR